jgi:hypothetical protein
MDVMERMDKRLREIKRAGEILAKTNFFKEG